MARDRTKSALNAASSGAALKQRAHEGVQRQHQAGQAQAAQTAQFAASSVAQDRQLDTQEAGQKERERSNQSRENLAKRGQDIQMADKGLESEVDPRQQKLEEDMRRGEEQGSKPLEFAGERIVPGEERKQKGAREQALDETKAETERIRANAYNRQVTAQANKAVASGNEKQFKDSLEKLGKPIQSNIATLNNAMSSDANKSQAAIQKLKQRYSDVQDPEVQQALESGFMNPALRRFMQNEIMTANVKVMADTGELPVQDTSDIDFASPMMQAVQQFAGTATSVASALGIQADSWKERNRMINKAAASMALSLFSGQQNQGQMVGPSQAGVPGAEGGGGPQEEGGFGAPAPQQGPTDEQLTQPRQREEGYDWDQVK